MHDKHKDHDKDEKHKKDEHSEESSVSDKKPGTCSCTCEHCQKCEGLTEDAEDKEMEEK
ncbi:MAG: hypothetical protein KBE09_04800 [Candidatus Pacebacteria bacterium]|nr:hypothetical protein [Candidatus Paceibacterota bacterium]